MRRRHAGASSQGAPISNPKSHSLAGRRAAALRPRRGGPETWGVNAEQLELDSGADIAVTRQGVRRGDAFGALAGSLSKPQRAAADRLILDLAELYGVAGSFGVAGTERIVGSPAANLSTERKCRARQRLEAAFRRIGAADQALLVAIAGPIVLGAATASWRDVVARVTGERQDKPQAARVRAALENLRLAYGLGPPAPRLHPFGLAPLQQPVGRTPMAVSATNEASCALTEAPPGRCAPEPQGRGRVISGPPELEPIGRYVLARVLGFTQVSASAFANRGERSSGVSYARALAAYLLNVELGVSQRDCARVLPITQQSIDDAVGRIEELREDPALDTAIDLLAEDARRRFGDGPPAANDN